MLHGKLTHYSLLLLGAECGVNADVEKHLELGKKLLAAGQLADALSQFHAAVGWYANPDHSLSPILDNTSNIITC